MLKEILYLLIEKNKSIKEISFELKIQPELLKERLDMLSHMGYLEKIEGCGDIKDNRREGDIDNSDNNLNSYYCSNCLLSKSCKDSTKERKKYLSGYILTEKGKKFMETQ